MKWLKCNACYSAATNFRYAKTDRYKILNEKGMGSEGEELEEGNIILVGGVFRIWLRSTYLVAIGCDLGGVFRISLRSTYRIAINWVVCVG